MERIYNIVTNQPFDVPEDDFDKFQEIFSQYEPRTHEGALDAVEAFKSEFILSREYTDDEIKSIFEEDAELSGMNIVFAKDKISDSSARKKAEKELNDIVIKKRKTISLESAKELLKIVKAFESPEFNNVN